MFLTILGKHTSSSKLWQSILSHYTLLGTNKPYEYKEKAVQNTDDISSLVKLSMFYLLGFIYPIWTTNIFLGIKIVDSIPIRNISDYKGSFASKLF